jgi:hypothetical protein
MVAGRGYFVNNTSAAGIVKLPISASAGDTIAIKDYAGNFGTNSLVIQRNGHNIQGIANDGDIKTNRASVELVYIDATKGWLYTNESNIADLKLNTFIEATGGTVTTSGNFKIHSFTGDGNFVVAQAGTSPSPSVVDYLVVAGGGSGGVSEGGGGGGAGGYRESSGAASGCYTRSPLGASVPGITVSAQTYPVTVGGGGAAPTGPSGNNGSNSVFSTITSTGGGAGARFREANDPQSAGGSGGGATGRRTPGCGPNPGANGNTPPVSPPQGNPGGHANTPSPTSSNDAGGGGGGATAAGTGSDYNNGTAGGAGATSHITGSPVSRAGGGGGGSQQGSAGYGAGTCAGGGHGGAGPSVGADGTANTGGGGGGGGGTPTAGRQGGKGIVILRYKFQ